MLGIISVLGAVLKEGLVIFAIVRIWRLEPHLHPVSVALAQRLLL